MATLNEKSPMGQMMSYMRDKLSDEDFKQFEYQVKKNLVETPPVVAVIGKAGVGKTSTINNLFDVEEYVVEPLDINTKGHIGEIKRGTTQPVKKHFELKSGICLDIVDLPGLGDDIETDLEFEMYYREILPKCDIVLYILDAIDRSYAEDERILTEIVFPCDTAIKEKIIIAMNKIDLIGEKDGYHWDTRINMPDRRQEALIERKQKDISSRFSHLLDISRDKIQCYSALKRYCLLELLYSIVHTTPLGFIFAISGAEILPRDRFGDGMLPERTKTLLEMTKDL